MRKRFYFFSIKKKQFSIDHIRIYLHLNKPAGSWIENYSIVDNTYQFLVFFELKGAVKNVRDIFQQFRFSSEKEALTEFVIRIPPIIMIYLMLEIKLDRSPIEINARFSSFEMKKKVIFHYKSLH
jgi:hypothetical protein